MRNACVRLAARLRDALDALAASVGAPIFTTPFRSTLGDELRLRGEHPPLVHSPRRRSVGFATLQNEDLGFIRAAEVATKAAERERIVDEVLKDERRNQR